MNQEKVTDTTLEILNSRYSRVSENIRFKFMLNTTLMVIGIGASGQMVEQFCRLGIKRFHLFDYDIVERNNLTSQNFSTEDVGLPKSKALMRRLKACEFEKDSPYIPPLQLTMYGDFLAISDEEIERIIQKERAKDRQVILLMLSDYHPAQARGNRVALKFNVPTFWAGIYRMGMAGEIIFFLRDYGLPCYRCITESRYRFFNKIHLLKHLNGDFRGSGKSAGLPMAASFIDSILGHLIIGVIHLDIEDNQHGGLIRRLLREKRNFIQCQLDPNYKLNDQEDIFAQIQGSDQIAFNTIFQQESIDSNCQDCSSSHKAWMKTDYTKEYRHRINEKSHRF